MNPQSQPITPQTRDELLRARAHLESQNNPHHGVERIDVALQSDDEEIGVRTLFSLLALGKE